MASRRSLAASGRSLLSCTRTETLKEPFGYRALERSVRYAARSMVKMQPLPGMLCARISPPLARPLYAKWRAQVPARTGQSSACRQMP
jgi:hypothetical protein